MTATEPRSFDRPDARAFLCAIADAPDDDLSRLALADWLTENGDEARAELIRLQVELETFYCAGCRPHHPCRFAGQCRKAPTRARESALLAANGDRWLRGSACEDCGGNGRCDRRINERCECPACWGTGDAGGLLRRTKSDVLKAQSGAVGCCNRHADQMSCDCLERAIGIEYVRGLKHVEVPHAADVWRKVTVDGCRTCRVGPLEPHDPHCSAVRKMTYGPAAWASAVCRCHPDVIEVVVGDKKPYCVPPEPDAKNPFCFRFSDHWQHDRHLLPIFLRPHVTAGEDGANIPMMWFPTEPAATTALARAVVRWVRSFPEARA